jgi:hypothetical protein
MKRRSARGKAKAPAATDPPARARRYSSPNRGDFHRAPSDVIEALALRALYSYGGAIDTQKRLYEEVMDQLKGEGKDLRIGPERMRTILLSSKRIVVEVRYAARPVSSAIRVCPVCRKPVVEIHNATLDGGKVVAGFKCTSCTFWTPLKRRVPCRYTFRAAR